LVLKMVFWFIGILLQSALDFYRFNLHIAISVQKNRGFDLECVKMKTKTESVKLNSVLNFIGGEFCHAFSTKILENINPATGKLMGTLPDSGAEDANAAVGAAQNAFHSWSQTPVEKRADWLNRIAQKIEDRAVEFALAETRDQGKPWSLALKMDIPRAVENFRFFADLIKSQGSKKFVHEKGFVSTAQQEPAGVAVLITPWNLPLYLLTWKLAPALVAGNTVVCKPSEFTSTTAYMLAQIFEELQFPKGVVNFVFGTGEGVGSALVSHPEARVISFTGGTQTGAKIASLAAPQFKKVSLELGGKNPALIFADADLKKAVAETVRSSFLNQGEICLCTSRIYVEKPIFKEFCDSFVAETQRWTVGDPEEPSHKLGALISAAHLKKVDGYVQAAVREGAKVLTGGSPLKLQGEHSQGFFYPPTTLVDVPMNSVCLSEEIFGPVVCVVPFEGAKEALRFANETKYGLCATIWTQNETLAKQLAHEIQTGTVWINEWLARDLNVPFGGMKQSGLGREGGLHSLDFFSNWKTFVTKPSLAESKAVTESKHIQNFQSSNAAEPVGPYPHAKRVNDLLFLSGIGPREKGTSVIPGVTLDKNGKIESYCIETQFRSCMRNVIEVLQSASLGLEHIVDVQVYLTDISADFKKFNESYKTYFQGDTGPTRTTIGVTGLPTPIAVELKVTAHF
jgi:acyl-CoA reductase-like NAD-dependent aldehyde dehydrogenase/enamine deaminase RidA (YjgF/YER057c/UK114 family)